MATSFNIAALTAYTDELSMDLMAKAVLNTNLLSFTDLKTGHIVQKNRGPVHIIGQPVFKHLLDEHLVGPDKSGALDFGIIIDGRQGFRFSRVNSHHHDTKNHQNQDQKTDQTSTTFLFSFFRHGLWIPP